MVGRGFVPVFGFKFLNTLHFFKVLASQGIAYLIHESVTYNKILLPANGPRQLHYVQEQNRVLKNKVIFPYFLFTFHFILFRLLLGSSLWKVQTQLCGIYTR